MSKTYKKKEDKKQARELRDERKTKRHVPVPNSKDKKDDSNSTT